MTTRWLLVPYTLLALCAPASAHTCTTSLTVACLLDDRFQVEVVWSDEADNPFTLPSWGMSGVGTVELMHPQTDPDTALFAFFEVGTPTMMVRILDVGPLTGRFWVLASASTNVAFTLTVTDTVSGAMKSYEQPQGIIISTIIDTDAFPSPLRSDPSARFIDRVAVVATDCGPTTLCLGDGRFEVEVDRAGSHVVAGGPGFSIPVSSTTGLFWFFEESNLELMVNIIDGQSVNGHFWVYVATLTNVEWTMTIRDTRTRETWIYENPAFESTPVLDREALEQVHTVTAVPILNQIGIVALVLLLMSGGVLVMRRG